MMACLDLWYNRGLASQIVECIFSPKLLEGRDKNNISSLCGAVKKRNSSNCHARHLSKAGAYAWLQVQISVEWREQDWLHPVQ